jgi:FkbM family methyltransferase
MRADAAYLGDHTAITRTVHGAKLYVDTRDISLAPHLLLDGDWEAGISAFVLETLEPGWTVLDIGANVGWYTVLAAVAVGEGGHVHAFEANPRMVSLLRRTLSVNGLLERVTAVEAAVADEPGSVTFFSYHEHQGSSGLGLSEHAAAAGEGVTELTVRATSLDAHFPQGTHVDFIKIDAEGAEPQIIAGARRLLEENPHARILMEYTASNRPAADALFELGWTASLVGEDGEARPLEPAELDDHEGLDMLYFEPVDRTVHVLAFADELIEHPEMLHAWARAAGENPHARLVVHAPGADPSDLERRLGPLVASAGGPEVIALTESWDDEREVTVVTQVCGVYSRSEPEGPLALAPRVDERGLAGLLAACVRA